jgi:hypothetical protein
VSFFDTLFVLAHFERRRHGAPRSETSYSDGYLRNIANFCTAQLKHEWLYAFPPTGSQLTNTQNYADEDCGAHGHCQNRTRIYVKSVPLDQAPSTPVFVQSVAAESELEVV